MLRRSVLALAVFGSLAAIVSTAQSKGTHLGTWKPTLTAIETVSKDGKTMTFEQKGTNAQGQQVHNVVILEKQ